MFALNSLILYIGYFISLLTKKKRKDQELVELKEKEKFVLPKALMICGLVLAFAVFIINILVTELGKSVDSAILFSVSYAISIIITILVGAIFYKEKITRKNIVGILLCVVALAMINFL